MSRSERGFVRFASAGEYAMASDLGSGKRSRAHERDICKGMGEPQRPIDRADESTVHHTTDGCNDPRDSCRAAGRTSKSRTFPLGSSLEPGPPARIVATGMERYWKGFPSRHDSGRGLPIDRSPGRLPPGIADYGSDPGGRSVCSGSWADQSHRKNGVCCQTCLETTTDPISKIVPVSFLYACFQSDCSRTW